jgi:hypothetical protein
MQNSASGQGAMVPGGEYNSAVGSDSFAAGYRAKANHDGAFVWGDHNGDDIASTGPNQFVVRAGGGLFVYSNNVPLLTLDSAGNLTAAGRINSSTTNVLEFSVNGFRALRLEPTTSVPNLIGGYAGNAVAPGVIGAFIGGGGTPDDGVGRPWTNWVAGRTTRSWLIPPNPALAGAIIISLTLAVPRPTSAAGCRTRFRPISARLPVGT